MKVIKDIRIYRSRSENISGNSMPGQFSNKELNIIVRRIAMKLRESGFSMGDFDHLYINLTTCAVEDNIAPSKRGTDKFHSWYREYDVGISEKLFDILETPQCIRSVIELSEQVLLKFFSTPQFDHDFIHSCISEALSKGEDMLIKYKEKKSAGNKAVIYLRYLDNGRYFPLLKVFSSDDRLLLEKDLPETNHLDAFGTIQLNAGKVTLQPKKNDLAKTLEPITFVLMEL